MPTWTGGRADAPRYLSVDGQDVIVRRSWPGKKGVRSYECLDGRHRVRAVTVAADGTVSMLPFAHDPALPSLHPGDEVLVHRAGRRAVVRVGDTYVKHVRPGKADAPVAAGELMGRVVREAGFAVARVLCHTRSSITTSAVPGVTLLHVAERDWQPAWECWQRAWPRVAGAVDASSGWPVHDAAAERDVVTSWVDKVLAFDPEGFGTQNRPRLEDLRRRVLAGLRDITEVSGGHHVPAHRDLHGGQILYDAAAGRLGLLDLDTAVLAERELDLANLDVHREMRVHQGLLTPQRSRVAQEAIAAVASRIGADPERMAAYEAATWLRLVCVYAFRPQWRTVTQEILDRL